jgi:probable rRNA maturation factor
MEILIRNEFPEIEVDLEKVEQKIKKILISLNCNKHEISILFIGNQGIRELNQQFRDIDHSTDVLSFPQDLEGEPEIPGVTVLGDVVISLETARNQSSEHGLSLDEEIILLLIHGILHLLGYDHELSELEDKRMRAKTRELLDIIYPGKKLADTCNF